MLAIAIEAALTAVTRSGVANISASARKGAILGVAGLVATAFGVAAIGCAVAALWLYEAPLIGQPLAALLSAGCLLLVGVIVMGGAILATRKKRARAAGPSISPDVLLAEANRLFKDHKGSVLVAALIAGMLAGNSGRKS